MAQKATDVWQIALGRDCEGEARTAGSQAPTWIIGKVC
jgi:hypothetical protein